jgi:AraC family transcriptional regulator of adaptative response / DNA-3-methyladenine glycosylase II
VGYSTRQLDRLFTDHIGATPSFVARSRRAHFARRLLDETDLPMDVVSRAAGFGSVRQMNRVVDEIFRLPPSALRAKRRRTDVLAADGGLALKLPVNGPFSQSKALDHVRSRLTSGVEGVEGNAYRRTTQTCGHPGAIEVFLRDGQPDLELRAHLPTFDSIIDDVARIRWMFGLHEDTTAAEAHLMGDQMLGATVSRQRGLRVTGGWDRFETAVRIVVGQQVSVVAANKMAAGIAHRWGVPTPAPVLGLDRIFPTPDRLFDLPGSGVGMPESRVETIRALSRATMSGELDLYGTADADATRAQLLAIPGIGPWTADMIEMRVLRNPDTFPAGDLGIRKAVSALAGAEEVLAAAEVDRIAEEWRPHRSLAAQHLWLSLMHPTQERGDEARD